MPHPPEFLRLSDFLSLWQVYDPAVKSDLYSSAVRAGDRLFLIDPTPFPPFCLDEITAGAKVAGILVTNANHPRAAVTFAKLFKVPIFAGGELAEFAEADVVTISAGEVDPGLSAIALPGAAPAEMAFHFAADGGTIVIGDALINFEPHGFTFLPAKYCSNQKEMRRSLCQLLDWRFERLLFAHGTPIMTSARERLETLLR